MKKKIIEGGSGESRGNGSVFEALFECAPDALLAVDRAGQIVQANKNVERIFGYPPDELIGQSINLLIPKAVRGSHDERLKDYFAKPGPREMDRGLDLCAVRKDGTEFPVAISLNSTRVNGRHLALAAVRDITEKTQTRRALQQSEERLRKIFDNMQDAVFICDAEKDVIYDVNAKACKMLGYSREELLTLPASSLHPDDMDKVRTFFETVIRRGSAWTEELTCCGKDGKKFAVEVRASSLPSENDDGAPTMMALVRDVTERKQEERALHLARFCLEHASEPTFLIRTDGSIEYANQAAAESLDYSLNDLLSLNVKDIILGVRDEDWDARRLEVRESKSLVREGTHRRRDGSTFPVETKLTYLDYEGAGYMLASARDVTGRKKAEEALRQSEERFFKIFRSAPIPIMLGRVADGAMIDVNDFFCKVSGYAREELIGKTVFDLNLLADSGQREAIVKTLKRDGRVRDMDVTLRSRDGRDHSLLYSAEVVEVGGESCLLASAQDVTEQKEAERNLSQSAARFRRIFESLPIGACVIQAGKVVFANSVHAHLFGFTEPEQSLGKNVLDYIDESEVDRIRDYMARRLSGDPTVPNRYETLAHGVHGKSFPVEVTVALISYEGKPATLAVIQDLSERKRLKMFESILPVCSMCGMVRDDSKTPHGAGEWSSLENYVKEHSETSLSHTFCPVCVEEYRRSQGLPPAPRNSAH